MFACGYLLQDGSQCLHVSRRKALACVERGRLVDFANQCKKEEWAAKGESATDRKNMIHTNDLLDAERAKVQKLEASLKIVTEERDALAQAAIHTVKTIKDLESTLEGVRAERDAFVNEAKSAKEAVVA